MPLIILTFRDIKIPFLELYLQVGGIWRGTSDSYGWFPLERKGRKLGQNFETLGVHWTSVSVTIFLT